MRLHHLLCLGLVLAAAPHARADGPGPEGTYRISYALVGGNAEVTVAIVKLENKDGKATATLPSVAGPLAGAGVKSVRVEDGVLTLVFDARAASMSFVGRIPAKAGQEILGSFGTETAIFPAVMVATQETELDPKASRRPIDDGALKKLGDLASRVNAVRAKIFQTKDKAEQQKLIQEFNAASAELKKSEPGLLREALLAQRNPAARLGVALLLLNGATPATPADDLKSWAAGAAKDVRNFDPRLQLVIHRAAATALMKNKALAGEALEFARAAEKALDKTSPVQSQVEVLGLLERALNAAGKGGEAKDVQARLERLEGDLDKEYLKSVPPFKPGTFAGRKAKSDRAVLMELFTGAQCPPCVAADVAFDALEKTYKPGEVVLLQYHVHIPGPDPMTTPDSEARFQYYRDTFPEAIRGAPSTVFDGKPAAGGGGAMAAAEKKYQAYRDVIDPLLETPAGAKLAASAVRKGDSIAVTVNVSDLGKFGDNVRLRLALVEEKIRYVGGNKIRFHHQVVRNMPGGPEGIALKEKDHRHTVTIDLPEVRKSLTTYLDDFVAKRGAFPNPSRPLALENLRVVAFVQDDATREVLQATLVEVTDGGR